MINHQVIASRIIWKTEQIHSLNLSKVTSHLKIIFHCFCITFLLAGFVTDIENKNLKLYISNSITVILTTDHFCFDRSSHLAFPESDPLRPLHIHLSCLQLTDYSHQQQLKKWLQHLGCFHLLHYQCLSSPPRPCTAYLHV